MQKKVIASPLAPKAVGPYSQAIAAGTTLYVSGQLPIDAATGLMAEGIEAQTLANAYLALEHDLEIIPVINKIDLAPYVGASLEVMEHDSKKMRGERPFLFTNIRGDVHVDDVVSWIKENVLLEGM